MNFFKSNNFYLILGLLIGFSFSYIIELLKDCRRRKGIKSLLRNEILNCGADADVDLKTVSDSPDIKAEQEDTKRQILSLAAFLISRAMYGTIAFESNIRFLWLFKDNTQRKILNFYNTIFKLKKDFATTIELIKPDGPKNWPPNAIKSTYERQVQYREDIKNNSKDIF
jgi:hypothetical protein